jgi:hypothetical protein
LLGTKILAGKPPVLPSPCGVFTLSYSNFNVLPTNLFEEPPFKVLKKSPGFCCYREAGSTKNGNITKIAAPEKLNNIYIPVIKCLI